jgi:hypothetical protein
MFDINQVMAELNEQMEEAENRGKIPGGVLGGIRKAIEDLNKEGSIKIIIEGWEDKDVPSITENVNEFILYARMGPHAVFKASGTILFRMIAIDKIKESIVERL